MRPTLTPNRIWRCSGIWLRFRPPGRPADDVFHRHYDRILLDYAPLSRLGEGTGKRPCIKGIGIGVHAPDEDYRSAVGFIKGDPLSVGALVTTHKIDLYNACKDMFEYVAPYAKLFGEMSSISKRDGILCAHAKNPIVIGPFTGYFPK